MQPWRIRDEARLVWGTDFGHIARHMSLEALGARFHLARENAPRFRTKASAWRGLLDALRDAGHFDAVHAEVPAAVRALMEAPPAAEAWMPAVAFHFVFAALETVVDDDGMRQIAHEAFMRGPVRSVGPVLAGMQRLFGARPEAFLQRMPKFMEGQLTGVRFEVAHPTPRELLLTVRYEWVRGLPRASFAYWQGVASVTFELCGIEAESSLVDVDEDGRVGRIRFVW